MPKPLNSLPPLSLYIHLPWCVRKCPYCDFNSHEKTALPETEYVAALMQDLDTELTRIDGRKLHSIFFGGGTPSLFSPDAIHSILEGVEQRIPFIDEIEINLEANPGTVETGKFEGFRAAGVNRLSIGVQSFQADMLPRLGRIHNQHEAIRAAEMAHKAGFADAKGFNLDLMFGLPTQDIAAAVLDIQTAIDLQPTHISHYQLTLEPGTAFFYRPPALPKDDDIWIMQTQCQEQLSKYSYTHYEVSAYAQPNKQCQHNVNYWEFGDYIGIGAGAHGKITTLNDHQNLEIIRTSKVKTPEKFMRYAGTTDALDQHHMVAQQDLAFEFMMNALRLRKGFDGDLFTLRTGQNLNDISELETLLKKELLTQSGNHITTSELGWRYLNEVVEHFL